MMDFQIYFVNQMAANDTRGSLISVEGYLGIGESGHARAITDYLLRGAHMRLLLPFPFVLSSSGSVLAEYLRRPTGGSIDGRAKTTRLTGGQSAEICTEGF